MATVKLDLPAPVVTGAENGYLDPTTIPADGVTVRVPAYEGRAAGQWVYANFTGQAGSEEATAPVQVVDATTPMDFKISKAEVLKNESQAVTFEYKVARTQGALYSDSKSAPVDMSRGMPITHPIREDFEGFVSVGPKVIQLPGCQVVVSGGTFRLNESFQQPPFITGKSIVYTGSSNALTYFKFTFESPVKSLRLGVYQDPSINSILVVFDGGQSITLRTIISGWLELDSADYYHDNGIREVWIHSVTTKPIYIDNLSYMI